MREIEVTDTSNTPEWLEMVSAARDLDEAQEEHREATSREIDARRRVSESVKRYNEARKALIATFPEAK